MGGGRACAACLWRAKASRVGCSHATRSVAEICIFLTIVRFMVECACVSACVLISFAYLCLSETCASAAQINYIQDARTRTY